MATAGHTASPDQSSPTPGHQIEESVDLGHSTEPNTVIPKPTPVNPGPQIALGDLQWGLKTALPNVKVNFYHCDMLEKRTGRLATEEQLTGLIGALKNQSGVPFDYIDDGCYARAHLMNESLRQHGINHQKIFVSGDSLETSNELMDVDWRFHVAPLVFMDDGTGKAVPRVLDPSISDRPLTPEDWIKSFNKGDEIDVQFSDSARIFPNRFQGRLPLSLSIPLAVPVMTGFQWALSSITGEEYSKPREWWKPNSGGSFKVNGETRYVFPEGLARGTQTAMKFAWKVAKLGLLA